MEELKRRAAQLDNDLVVVGGKLDQNTEAIEGLTAEQRRQRERMDQSDRDRKWFVIAILIVAMFVAAVGLVAFRSEQNIRRGEAERQQLWCPVFSLAIGGYTDEQAAARGESYKETHRLMRNGYALLGCTTPIVPPAVPVTPK